MVVLLQPFLPTRSEKYTGAHCLIIYKIMEYFCYVFREYSTKGSALVIPSFLKTAGITS